jgi:hypothetical protein
MRPISDELLLGVAGASATLVGLFLVGAFFYLETGPRRSDKARRAFEPYLRSGARITLIVFAIPIFLSVALVALEPVYATVLFAVLSVPLLAANVDSAVRARGTAKVTGSTTLLVMEGVMTVMTLALLITPWVLGGLHPSREDLTWAVLLAFAVGFVSISVTVMSAFDDARAGSAAQQHDPTTDSN